MRHRIIADPSPLRALALTVTALSLTLACSSGPPPPAASGASHAERVQQSRVAKDEAFRLSADSPIPEAERATFTGLSYFPIDPTYNVPASIVEDRSARTRLIDSPGLEQSRFASTATVTRSRRSRRQPTD
jgi:uncharacterized protein (DUF1684 family)